MFFNFFSLHQKYENKCVHVCTLTCAIHLISEKQKSNWNSNQHELRTFLILKCENQTEKYYLIVDHSFHTTLLSSIKIVLKIKLFTLDLECYGLCISLYLS